MTHRRLGQVKSACGSRDALLADERIEHQEEIQVQLRDIDHVHTLMKNGHSTERAESPILAIMDDNEASIIDAPLAHYRETIIDPGSGERIAFLAHGPEAVVFDDYIPAGMSGPPVHWHPEQFETFEVLRGTLFAQVDRKWFQLEPGHQVTIPPGVPHTFDNARSSRDVVFRVTFSPGLDTDDLFRTLMSLGPKRASFTALLRLARAQTALASRFFMTSPALAWAVSEARFGYSRESIDCSRESLPSRASCLRKE